MTIKQRIERIHELAQKRSAAPAIIAQADAQRDAQEIERLSAEALAEMAKSHS